MNDSILNSLEVENLAILVEEATRSTQEGVKRFVEPAQGTLRRATSKRHHIVFGRRGSGKSSLLRKAAADLTIDRRPIAYVDLETFKGHSYPDVLLSVLIKAFSEFQEWLETAAINPPTKKSFWKKLFGTSPKRPAFNRKEASKLASKLREQVLELRDQLNSPDNIATQKVTKNDKESGAAYDAELNAKTPWLSGGGKTSKSTKTASGEQVQENFQTSKTDFLHRHILDYQSLFQEMSALSDGDSYLFLDDLYHIRRADQARVIDYFHRIAKGNGLWLKIGTIKHRTDWYIHGDPPIGLKIGDDADDIDLDLTLEQYSLAKTFLVKILQGFLNECADLSIPGILNDGAIDRLVLASGGVARDFLGIFRRSIDTARERGHNHRGDRIGAEDVNAAALKYNISKQEEFKKDTLEDQSKFETEFRRIRDFCIDIAKANVFLVDVAAGVGTTDLIQELADLRLIHKVSSHVTVSARPGSAFVAYLLDVSQYAEIRRMHNLEMIDIGGVQGRNEQMRRARLIYDPDKIEARLQNLEQEKSRATRATSDRDPDLGQLRLDIDHQDE